METVIKIADREFKMKASAATLIHYRDKFGADMLREINLWAVKNKANNVIERSAYIMAKDAGEELPDFEEWLEGFPINAFSNASGQIVDFWNKSSETTVESKKKAEQSTEK